MSQRRSRVPVLIGLCVPLLAAGCGAGTVPVKGVVTLDGRPLAGAFVTFIPEGESGRQAHGTADAGGAFRLTTPGLGDGALPGAYRVTVAYSDPVEVAPSLTSAEDVQAAMVKASASKKSSVVLPAIYRQPDRTVLRHRVPEDGDAKLELSSAPR